MAPISNLGRQRPRTGPKIKWEWLYNNNSEPSWKIQLLSDQIYNITRSISGI